MSPYMARRIGQILPEPRPTGIGFGRLIQANLRKHKWVLHSSPAQRKRPNGRDSASRFRINPRRGWGVFRITSFQWILEETLLQVKEPGSKTPKEWPPWWRRCAR